MAGVDAENREETTLSFGLAARGGVRPDAPADGPWSLRRGGGRLRGNDREAPADRRPLLGRLLAWTRDHEREGLARLGTYHETSRIVTLLPPIPKDDVGSVTVYDAPGAGGACVQFWRSVITRRAPASLEPIELAAAPAKIGQGTTTRSVSDELLEALTAAYREAAAWRVQLDPATQATSGDASP